ncbi:MAG: bifunctional proline dehydrogenase/L-glutamate gamma-semialdehyde dehydrogenase PutA, partial [Pseudomonadota bacterium]|nr:bifunctional proline dehydrogenase/L-glutamate gamma-semialdehyde dehydrogenase PutA [Pseudomonadota bacterium]
MSVAGRGDATTFAGLRIADSPLARRLSPWTLKDESRLVEALLPEARSDPASIRAIEQTAAGWVEAVRTERAGSGPLDAFLETYDLSTEEGVGLMCVAEALLRIPDADTADRLIADRLADKDWERHLGESHSLFVNASTWGLMLSGRLVSQETLHRRTPGGLLRGLAARLGEPVVRTAISRAMRILARQFVVGGTIHAALQRVADHPAGGNGYSFDMLGEAALTAEDAARYRQAYGRAIEVVGAAPAKGPLRHGVSVKLSALSPRFETFQVPRVTGEVVEALRELALLARERNVPLTVDAEEADRLVPTLAVFEAVYRDAGLAGWEGFGLAVQAYQRRAGEVLRFLVELAGAVGRQIPVRLVKGAYWDTEIKRAQERGLDSFPVFTRKVNTDVSYLACVRRMCAAAGRLLPQFATHNAHTIAYVLHHAPAGLSFEFQRLHGMGEALYRQVAARAGRRVPCRVYGPVGTHEDLLPYLVRRLLENGANTSFVHRVLHEEMTAVELVRDPVARAAAQGSKENPRIAQPPVLFGAERRNAAGLDLHDGALLGELATAMERTARQHDSAAPVIDGEVLQGGECWLSRNPADRRVVLGRVTAAGPQQADRAVAVAVDGFAVWNTTPVAQRAAALNAAADLFEAHRAELMALCIREAGKCLTDALAEVREAVDFLRYYAVQAQQLMQSPVALPGPAGEHNELHLEGRGCFVCISPWNFPLAIFTGQVAAALVTGNTVVAKPAPQTALIAARAVALLHRAGIPGSALQFTPGDGALGARLVANPRLAGVVFTGSTASARSIYRALAAGQGPIPALIAETGGVNAMVVDSTALPEQVVRDAVQSAFNAAGQRCSALRLLLLQEEIADPVVALLSGHMAELSLGDPAKLHTDVGPVIDSAARERLLGHRQRMHAAGRVLYECPVPAGLENGTFVAPLLVELPGVADLDGEHFGPILHVVRFAADELDGMLEAVASLGYGLTFGIQTRIERRGRDIARRVPAGNVYVNRNLIGAVVGSQP